VKSLSRSLNILVEKYLPSAFLFALILTIIAAAMGVFLGGSSPLEVADMWYAGFWKFLEFGMQMVVVLVTGYALAKAPLVNRLLARFATIPKTQLTALTVVMIVSGVLGIISWGLGFVGGTIIAIEVAKRTREADFRLLVASSYSAVIATQPMSLALTAPLLVNTPGHPLEEKIGLIPVTETIFSPTMLLVSILGFIGIYAGFAFMAPKPDEVVPLSGEISEPAEEAKPQTVAEKIDNSIIVNTIVVIFGIIAISLYFIANGFNLELNIMNFIFLMVGIGLHGSPAKYAKCITEGIPAASGIVLQFPFYAGIIGIMAGSGLIVMIGQWFASISTEATFPLFTYIAAMIVNVFVPSAGGQWQVQGPVMIEAIQNMNINPATIVNAVSVGDMTTNLLQPFFVLPTLGLAKLGLKDIWGYCMTAMLILMVISGTIFLLVPVLGW